MATLTKQQIVNTGLNPSYSAAAGGGDVVAPGDTTYLHVKNGGGAPINVTVDNVTPSNYGTDADLVVSVPNAGERIIGPLPAARFARASDGLAAITYSAVTSVTVGAFFI